MGILAFLAVPVVIAGLGVIGGQARTRLSGRVADGLRLPALWPRKGPCFGEPIREGGTWFGGRPGELCHRNLAGDREYLR